jgi:post-segregation antitoxin (ccd killing protein)
VVRLNISVPDQLAAQARAHGIPLSETCQRALGAAIAAAEAREDVMTDIDAVAERLRANTNAHDLAVQGEGRRDGIKWAKDYATAEDLRRAAGWDRDGKFPAPPSLAAFARAELGASGVGSRLSPDNPYGAGFIAGAREVWTAVRPLL